MVFQMEAVKKREYTCHTNKSGTADEETAEDEYCSYHCHAIRFCFGHFQMVPVAAGRGSDAFGFCFHFCHT